MASRVVASKRSKFRAAAETGPCAQCPWRTSNQGTRHPLGWYTKANIRRLWNGLRRGERMTCHPTDPDNPVAPGGRELPEGATTRECAGALILVHREMDRLQEVILAGGGWAEYWAAHPKGLTKVGAALTAMNLQWGGAMPGTLKMAKPNMNDLSVSHVDLTPWEPK